MSDTSKILRIGLIGFPLAGRTSLLSIYSMLCKMEDPDIPYDEIKNREDPKAPVIFPCSSLLGEREYDGIEFYLNMGEDIYQDLEQIFEKVDAFLYLLSPDYPISQFETQLFAIQNVLVKTGREDLRFALVMNKTDIEQFKYFSEEILELLSSGFPDLLRSRVGHYFPVSIQAARNDARKSLIKLYKMNKVQMHQPVPKLYRPPSANLLVQPLEEIIRTLDYY